MTCKPHAQVLLISVGCIRDLLEAAVAQVEAVDTRDPDNDADWILGAEKSDAATALAEQWLTPPACHNPALVNAPRCILSVPDERSRMEDVKVYAAAAEGALRRIAEACGSDRKYDYPLQILSDVEQQIAAKRAAEGRVEWLTLGRDNARRMLAIVISSRDRIPERTVIISMFGVEEADRLFPIVTEGPGVR